MAANRLLQPPRIGGWGQGRQRRLRLRQACFRLGRPARQAGLRRVVPGCFRGQVAQFGQQGRGGKGGGGIGTGREVQGGQPGCDAPADPQKRRFHVRQPLAGLLDKSDACTQGCHVLCPQQQAVVGADGGDLRVQPHQGFPRRLCLVHGQGNRLAHGGQARGKAVRQVRRVRVRRQPPGRRGVAQQMRAAAADALQPAQPFARLGHGAVRRIPHVPGCLQGALPLGPFLRADEALAQGLAAFAPPVEGGVEGAGRHFSRGRKPVPLLLQGAAQGRSLPQAPGRGQQGVGHGAARGQEVAPPLAQPLRIEREELGHEPAVGAAEQALHPGLAQRRVVRANEGVAPALGPGEAEGAAVRHHAGGRQLHAPRSRGGSPSASARRSRTAARRRRGAAPTCRRRSGPAPG